MLATHAVRGRRDRHYLQQIISQFQNLLLKHLKWDPYKPGVTSNLSGYKFSCWFPFEKSLSSGSRRDGDAFEHENLMKSSKSTAVKMYANLKKMKQNISLGARLTNFLNSLFANGKPKPAAIKPSPEDPKRPSPQPSTLAVVSRWCLNKTPRSTMG
nr:protein BIG GRAIN 1-like A [Ipomoea batatas]